MSGVGDERAALLAEAAALGARYLDGLGGRPVAPDNSMRSGLAELARPLADGGMAPEAVLRLLDRFGSPATVASAGGRYFGFVTGGSLPAALAANVLAAAWDQNAAFEVMSPAAAALEASAAAMSLDVLGLPPDAAVGFTSGATGANLAGLAAARHAVLAAAGWNVEEQGLFGAPPVTVIVGDEVHASLLKALQLLGFGRERVTRVAVDGQGRLRPEAMPPIGGPAILCLQAGNVNTGAFDPAAEAIARAKAGGAWVHVDGAFGLWTLAAPMLRALAEGFVRADSWALDAHKWLNVPYDSGLAIVRDGLVLKSAMTVSAAYLIESDLRDGSTYVPEMSRRARGIEVWAALRSLGRNGVADLVERTVGLARRFAAQLSAAGIAILNEVVINQVLAAFGDAERTRRVTAAVQREGTCWCGGTVWQGRTAMRISVSSWATTEADIDRSAEAVIRIARETN